MSVVYFIDQVNYPFENYGKCYMPMSLPFGSYGLLMTIDLMGPSAGDIFHQSNGLDHPVVGLLTKEPLIPIWLSLFPRYLEYCTFKAPWKNKHSKKKVLKVLGDDPPSSMLGPIATAQVVLHVLQSKPFLM